MDGYLLTYDIITSTLKASIFAPEGTLMAEKSVPLLMEFAGNHAQQRPEDWWEALCNATHALLRRVPAEAIACLSFTDQVQVCLCVDKDGDPLTPAMTWSDTRSLEVSDPFAHLGQTLYLSITGQRNTPQTPARKLWWLQNKQPETFERAFQMLGCKEYLAYRLTGGYYTDHSDAAATGLYDIRTRSWSQQLCSACRVDPQHLPQIVEATEPIGTVHARAAKATGLSTATQVVMGSGDFTCSAIGAGCTRPGDMYLNLGSSSWLASVTKGPITRRSMAIANIPYATEGTFLPLANCQEAGSIFKWLGAILKLDGRSGMVNPYENQYPYEGVMELAQAAPPGCEGLSCQPFLLGPATGFYSQDLAGSFHGLTARHTRAHLLRSALEGVCYYFAFLHQVLQAEGQPEVIRATGVASHEDFWLQMLADVLDTPIENTTLRGTTDSIGAAIIAGAATGIYTDLAQAGRFWKPERHFTPDPTRRDIYREGRRLFTDKLFC